jgi:hypothetical protein
MQIKRLGSQVLYLPGLARFQAQPEHLPEEPPKKGLGGLKTNEAEANDEALCFVQ